MRFVCSTSSVDAWRISPRTPNARVDALVTVVDAHSLGALEPASFDAVLIDAPCSSVGALRRTPSLRYSHDDPAASAEIQRGILTAAAPLVKPGGRLVYATCSVLSIENQCVARAFEREHDEFAPWPFEDAVATSPTVGARSPERLLLPHVHAHGWVLHRAIRQTRDVGATLDTIISTTILGFSMPISAWCSPSASSSNSSTMLVNAPSAGGEGVTSRRETLEFRYARGGPSPSLAPTARTRSRRVSIACRRSWCT